MKFQNSDGWKTRNEKKPEEEKDESGKRRQWESSDSRHLYALEVVLRFFLQIPTTVQCYQQSVRSTVESFERMNRPIRFLVLALVANFWRVSSFSPCPSFTRHLQTINNKDDTRLHSMPPPPGESFIVILGDDDDDDEGEDYEDEEHGEEEPEEDAYTQAAKEEFEEASSDDSSTLAMVDGGGLTTFEDWGGALGKLRQRVEDVESGKSQDPSHALFRVMSSQTPNQVIGKFVTSANPQTVQAMSGAVSSLLGGRYIFWHRCYGSCVDSSL
jgi:hypothetical protein